MSFTDMRKPDSSQHLTPEQIRSVIEDRAGEQPAHLSECVACAEIVRQLSVHSNKPAPDLNACISHERLLKAASGQDSFTQSEIEHFVLCGACARVFKDLADDLGDAQPEEMAHLISNSPAWHSSMARMMVASSPAAKRAAPGIWKYILAFGVAAVAVFSVALVLHFSGQKAMEAPRLLARSFEKQRVTSMRIEGAHFAPIEVTRGNSPSTVDLPSEGLQAAVLARSNLEKNAADPYWHAVQGEVFLLQGTPERAVTEFRIAEAANPNSSSYRLQLGSALCDVAIQKGSSSAYVEGIDVLRSFVTSHQQDTVALYNLGICLYYAGSLNEAKADLHKARELEKDPSWFADIDQWLERIGERLKTGSTLVIPDFGWEVPQSASPSLLTAADQNRNGKAASALLSARQAETVARGEGSRELLLWAQFEEVYALQRLSRAHDCRRRAQDALRSALAPSFKDLRAALLTEAGICSDILGDFQTAQESYVSAYQLATGIGMESLRPRLLGAQAALYNSEGLHAESEQLDLQALTTPGSLNPRRRYQFLSDLYLNAVAQRYFFAALEFEREAQVYALQSGNSTISASSYEDLAETCLRVKDRVCARQEQELAESLLKDFDPRTKEFYTSTWSIRRELIAPGAGRSLLESSRSTSAPSLRSNHYLSVPFLLLRGYSAFHDGDLTGAERNAIAAAEEVVRLRQNLSKDQTRFTWSQDARPVFELLVQIRLAQGRTQGALDCWESFRSLLRSAKTQVCAAEDLPKEASTFFVIFARLNDAYVQWTLLPSGELRVQTLPSVREIDRLSHLLNVLCSRPDSQIQAVASLSQRLADLILPGAILGSDQTAIVFESDGPLNELPYRALRVHGDWLGVVRSISIIPGLWAVRPAVEESQPETRLLLVGNAEDRRLSLKTGSSSLLGYRMGRISNFLELPKRIDEAGVVYYVGHASEEQAVQVALTLPDHLRVCRFAVLAACRTRGGSEFEVSGFAVLPDRLLQIGTAEVVASRWDLDSEQTDRLLQPMLTSPYSFALASRLRDSSRALAGTGVRHPYYWAGLDVYGVLQRQKGGYL